MSLKFCCQALIILSRYIILILRGFAPYNGIYDISKPASISIKSPVSNTWIRIIGAGDGNRTHLSGLEGRRTSRCTTPAQKAHKGKCRLSYGDRNLKKGEKVSFTFYISIPKNFYKINYFRINHLIYSLQASSFVPRISGRLLNLLLRCRQ